MSIIDRIRTRRTAARNNRAIERAIVASPSRGMREELHALYSRRIV